MAGWIYCPGVRRQANSNFKGRMYPAFGEAGYAFKPAEGLSLEPSVSVEANRVDQDGFTETGASGFNLSVADRRLDSVVSSAGMRITRQFLAESSHPFLVGVRSAWLHEFSDVNNLISARFADAPAGSFTIQGAPQSRNAASLGTELRMALRKNLQAFANYAATLTPSEIDHGVLGGFTLKL